MSRLIACFVLGLLLVIGHAQVITPGITANETWGLGMNQTMVASDPLGANQSASTPAAASPDAVALPEPDKIINEVPSVEPELEGPATAIVEPEPEEPATAAVEPELEDPAAAAVEPKVEEPVTTAEEPCCWAVQEYWPRKSCKKQCGIGICNRGWGVWQTEDVCCAPGVAFPDGCDETLLECWVVESKELETCMRDDRKCLQGYAVWGSKDVCCAPGTAFPDGCGPDPVPVEEPCWVLDTYWPARLCRSSTTLCGPAESGAQTWATEEECCAAGGAFPLGCSTYVPEAPCWVVDSYFPEQSCVQETDEAVCFRGWGVWKTAEICCSPQVAFPGGCSK